MRKLRETPSLEILVGDNGNNNEEIYRNTVSHGNGLYWRNFVSNWVYLLLKRISIMIAIFMKLLSTVLNVIATLSQLLWFSIKVSIH